MWFAQQLDKQTDVTRTTFNCGGIKKILYVMQQWNTILCLNSFVVNIRKTFTATPYFFIYNCTDTEYSIVCTGQISGKSIPLKYTSSNARSLLQPITSIVKPQPLDSVSCFHYTFMNYMIQIIDIKNFSYFYGLYHLTLKQYLKIFSRTFEWILAIM